MDVSADFIARAPAAPFNCCVYPTATAPLFTNAEIVRVTAIVGSTLTITRAQESTNARNIIAGDQIANTVTVADLTDIETAVNAAGTVTSVGIIVDPMLTVVNSPITTNGDIQIGFEVEVANTVLAGPTSGGDAAPSFRQAIEADLSLSDVTTNDTTAAKHGFAPKLSNVATEFLDGTGSFSTPATTFTAGTLAYSDPATIDFAGNDFQTVTLAGDITFQSSNLAAGKCISVRIVGDGSIRSLAFPGGWTFLGDGAPTDIAANKTGVLSVTSFSNDDANVVAAYAVEP